MLSASRQTGRLRHKRQGQELGHAWRRRLPRARRGAGYLRPSKENNQGAGHSGPPALSTV